MSARYLVVDGHSVIFSWPDFRALHNRNRAQARKALVDVLTQLHDTSAWRVTLVLDGKTGSQDPGHPAKPTDMVIHYAASDQTADSIIERLVAASGVAGDITVITADEAEKRTVEALGATAVSPDWLREELAHQQTSFADALNKVHRSARWRG